MTHGRLIGCKQPRTAGADRQQNARLYAPRNEIVVPFSSTDSETRKRSIENWFCLEHIPRRSRFRDRKLVAVLLPFCGTIFYNLSQTSPCKYALTRTGVAPASCHYSRLAAAPLQEVALSPKHSMVNIWSSRRRPSRALHALRFSTQSRHGNSSNDTRWEIDMRLRA